MNRTGDFDHQTAHTDDAAINLVFIQFFDLL